MTDSEYELQHQKKNKHKTKSTKTDNSKTTKAEIREMKKKQKQAKILEKARKKYGINPEYSKIETIKEEELSKSVNIIENIASANVYSEDNFIDKLNNEYGLTKDTFINIGFIKRNTTDEVFNIIKDFIVETVDSGKPFPLIIVHNAEDYIRILRSQGYIDASDDELTKNYNMMGASYSGYTSTPFILVNPKIFNTTKRNIGSSIFHEIIHHRVEKDTENDVITDDVKEALNDIVKDLVERKEEVLRYDIEDSIKNSISKSLKVACYNSDGTINEDVAYHELLAYTLSNPNLAGYLNNIYYKEETNRPSESIWKRIIDNLLKLFGIKVNKCTSTNTKCF